MGRGDVALENDEMEGRQGLGKRVLHRRKEFRRWFLGLSMKGTLFTLAGLAEAGRNRGEGAGGTKKRQLRSTGGDGSTSQLYRAVLEGPGSSGKGRQLLWSTQAGRGSWHAQRTLRAALQTSKSHLADKNAFGPPSYDDVCPPSAAHPFPVCQAPQQLFPAAPVVIPLTTRGHLARTLSLSTPHLPESQEWTPHARSTTAAQPDCRGSGTWPVPWGWEGVRKQAVGAGP